MPSPDPEMQLILERLRKLPAVDYAAMPITAARLLFEETSRPWNEGAPAIRTRELTKVFPGDILAVRILEVTPRTPYGVNTMRMNRGGLPGEFTLNRSVVIPFDMERGVAQ